jgi:ATP-dependent Clp protease ATP-binding subunit ClpA
LTLPLLQATSSFCTSDGVQEDALPDVSVLGKLSKDEKEHISDQTNEDTSILLKAAKDASASAGELSKQSIVPLRFRVILSALPPHFKLRVAARLEKMGDVGGGENMKYIAWVEALLSVPLSKIVSPLTLFESVGNQRAVGLRLHEAKNYLDSVVFGHRGAKQAILERLYSWISSPQSPQRPLALWGPPGNGKTTLARKGLAEVIGRPFSFIGLGGSADASYLLGHGYTYEGSQPGKIVECLSQARAMNPVIYFDELDKISGTTRGDELANVLIHLTDTTQNDVFRDRYLHGLDLDLRGALLVFSFNDKTSIPPVLLDRLDIVETEPFSREGQKTVLKDYIIPELLYEVGASKGSFYLAEEALDALLEKVDTTLGVRAAKAVVQQLLVKALIMRDTGDVDLIFPLKPGAFTIRDGVICASRDAVEAVCSATNNCRRRPPMSMYS